MDTLLVRIDHLKCAAKFFHGHHEWHSNIFSSNLHNLAHLTLNILSMYSKFKIVHLLVHEKILVSVNREFYI